MPSLILSQSPDDTFCVLKTSSNLLAMTVLIVGLTVFSKHECTFSLGLEKTSICAISGTALYDSSFTVSKNRLITVKLESCTDVYGNKASANGTVNAIGDGTDLISANVSLELHGSFLFDEASEDSSALFVYDGIQVTERHWVNTFRENLIRRIQIRMFGSDILMNDDHQENNADDEDLAVILSLSLLTGRAENQDNPIKDKARSCGCLHILALSGMHVSVFASLFLVLGKKSSKRWLWRTLAIIAVLFFAFVAGPRPSVMRAVIMFLLFPLEPRMSLPVCFCIHALLFPSTMDDLGCTFTYLSLAAIVYLLPLLEGAFFGTLPAFIRKTFLTGVGVMIAVAPLQIEKDGLFHCGALLATVPASALVWLSMILGLMVLVFGRLPFLLRANAQVYRLLDLVFSLSSRLPSFGTVGYLVTLGIVLLMAVSSMVLKTILRKHVSSKIDENNPISYSATDVGL